MVHYQKLEYLTLTALRERVWSESTIRNYLGKPDATKPNPHYRSAAPMRLYLRTRVEETERTDAWADDLRRTERRRISAAKATETKKACLMNQVDEMEIAVPKLPLETLTRRACAHYNRRKLEMERLLRLPDDNWSLATPQSAPEFLARISVNYLRHFLSAYDEALESVEGQVGVSEAYMEINRRVYAVIGAAYPSLAEECHRQLAVKLLV